MSDRCSIDVLTFAKAGGCLEGSIPAAVLARLRDVLSEMGGGVTYSIRGRIEDDGTPRLSVGITGTLHLLCQRCLCGVAYSFELRRDLRFLPNATRLPEVSEEEENVDDIVASGKLDVLDWVEDEILLGLPISPRHEEGRCLSPGNQVEHGTAGIHPFAVLAELKSETRNTKDL
ncbi:MAG: YceD family protein [Burkholderiales bacterium]